MAFHPKTFPTRLREGVDKLEAAADVEMVVAFAPASGSYADVDLLWAIWAAFGTLLIAVYGPWTFRVELLAPNLVITGLLMWWLSRRFPSLRRALTTRARRIRQVRAAAAQTFCDHRLSHTRKRRVALLYASALERRAEILTDVGLEGAVPAGVWHEARHRLWKCARAADLEQALFDELAHLTSILPVHLPPDNAAHELKEEVVMLP